ncbi:MAG TPA: dihydrodipicolinate synthase family protein [Gemmataceae bacterium]|jgi:4-hydroxy-tetrahydrodipicolinate synthase
MFRPLWAAVIALVLGALTQPRSPAACPACACGQPWAGVYPTVLTPWNCDGTVDEASLEAQLRYEMAGGVHGVLMLGSLGEGERASMEARAQVLAVTARTVAGCVPFLVGIHTCDLDCARAQMLQAKEAGAAAVLVKYKGCPHASGCQVLAFYQALSESAPLPIFYYHYPTDTDLKLSPAEIAAVVRLPNVAGVKFSTLDLREFEAVAAHARGCGKVYFTATALNLTQFMDAGGHGAMCPEAVLLPHKTVCVYKLWCDGRRDAAREAQKDLFVLSPVFRGGFTTEQMARKKVMFTQDHDIRLPMQDYEPQARLKATLNCLGVPTSSRVSCPLPGLTPRDERLVRQTAAKVRERNLR